MGSNTSKKIIGINIPCFNEEDNVIPLFQEIKKIFEEKLPVYDYIVQYVDNLSTDHTRERLIDLCKHEKKARAIFNSRNYKGKSALYGLLQAEGDCVVYMAADFQDPVEMIPEFIKKWEEGYYIVAGIKTTSKENKLLYGIRSLYYKIMKQCSNLGFIEQFCNFGLYDRKFIDIIAGLQNPNYSIRGNVAEYGYKIIRVPYRQQQRRSGKSNYNLLKLLNLAITNFIDYTDIILRAATITGCISSIILFIVAVVYFILKLVNWSEYAMGMAPLLIGIFLIGSIQVFLLGVIGEYILSIRKKVTDTPIVIEERRINYEKDFENNAKQ